MPLLRIAAALAAALLPTAAVPAPPLAGTLADAAALEASMRLQLAAGRYDAAEATALRLAALYRPTEPGRAAALLPWRIYARAMRDEEAGLATREALSEAFGALFTSLPDAEMADALPWYGADPDRLRDAVQRAERACEGAPLDSCASAADVVAARQSAAVWAYLMPASQSLIRADVERRFLVEEELLAMPDGARIAALVVRPRGAATRTALLNFTIYARDDWALSDAVKMAAHGYAGVVAFSRGKERGAGPIMPYAHDGADAAATIDWIARQMWSDGRVGMFSGSYNAFTQWAALKHRPAALRAIATNASNAPGIDTPMQGNVFRTFIYPWPLYVASGRGLDEATYGDRARWLALERNWYRSGRPYRDLEAIDGQPNPVFRTWLNHPAYDSWWRSMIPVGREFARIDIPVFVETGYFDGGMVGALHYLRAHLRWRPGADHRLLLGPYTHTAMQTGVLPNVNGIAVDRAAMIDLQDVRLAWFDHVFRGAPLPAILSDRINFEVMGANVWRHVPNLDAMADDRLRLYLGGPADTGNFRFADAPPPAAVEPELRVDFTDRKDVDDPAPAEGLDTRNALLFASAPLAQPIEIDGAFRARLEIVANKRDLDLSIAFFEQRGDGHFFPLASHLVRVSYAENPSRRHPLEPGRPRRLDIESQTVAARRLAAGSRIVALIGVPKRPDIEINYGTGGDVAGESIADAGAPLRVRFRSGSFIDLGVRR